MGAVPKELSPLLAAPWAVVAIAFAMLVTAIQLWRHRLRSVPGRLGFSVFFLVAAAAAVNLVLLVQQQNPFDPWSDRNSACRHELIFRFEGQCCRLTE
ncbi:hypothetical protein [Silicimonas sp. MF1-12-2]|uniref:hypothetical protein n=1 Tax=Silicimonas sp. MF1-12-2 TaxID=3384793 RepID=UPI0039B46778